MSIDTSTIGYDQTEIADMVAAKQTERLEKRKAGRLQAGLYRFEVKEAETKISKTSGNTYLSVRVAPLDIHGNARKFTTRYNLVLPLKTSKENLATVGLTEQRNKKQGGNGETYIGAPNSGFLTRYMQAVGIPVPVQARWDKELNSWVDPTTGSPVSDTQEAEMLEARFRAVLDFATAIASDPSTLSGHQFIAEFKYKNADDAWGEIGKIFTEIPAGASLTELE